MKFITYLLYIFIFALMGYITFLSYGLIKSEQPSPEKKGTMADIPQIVPKVSDERRPIKPNDEVTSS